MIEFQAKDFVPLMDEAIAKNCYILFAKGDGIFFYPFGGEFVTTEHGITWKNIVFAKGCNPYLDENCIEQANQLIGKDSIAVLIDMDDPVVQAIYQQKLDFEVRFVNGKCVFNAK